MNEAEVHQLYRAFNARDVATLLRQMAPEVDWPNGWEGGRVIGKEAVAAYWQRQWESIDPRVYPRFVVSEDNACSVTVHQVVKDPQGETLFDGDLVHRYELRDGLIVRMDITETYGEPSSRG